MTDSLAYASPPAYYRHSGRSTASAVLVGIVGSVVFGAAVGSIMGPLELFSHMIGFLKLMATAEFLTVIGGGSLLGLAIARVLIQLKSRSPILTYGCVLLGVAVAMYFAWAGWAFAFIRYAHGETPYFWLLVPERLFRFMRAINDTGTWYISTADAPKGTFLAIIWICELAAVLVSAMVVAKQQLGKKIFCEACNTWGKSRHLVQVKDEGFGTMQEGLRAGRADVFDQASPSQRGALTWCDVTLEGCPTCDDLQALTLTRTILTPTKKGKYSTKHVTLVKRVLLTPDQTVQIAMAAARIASGPATPPAALITPAHPVEFVENPASPPSA